MRQECKKENSVNDVSRNLCKKTLQKRRKIKICALILGMILLVSLISTTIILSCVDSDKIKVPSKLNEKTMETLSLYEQEVLDDFVKELVNSYNQRNEITAKNGNGINVISSERYLNRTEEFDDAFAMIKELAKTNSNLSTASNIGFLIVMSATLGTTSPHENSSPEEVDNYIMEQINKIIETYYK